MQEVLKMKKAPYALFALFGLFLAFHRMPSEFILSEVVGVSETRPAAAFAAHHALFRIPGMFCAGSQFRQLFDKGIKLFQCIQQVVYAVGKPPHAGRCAF
jgi:hypothetical protein